MLGAATFDWIEAQTPGDLSPSHSQNVEAGQSSASRARPQADWRKAIEANLQEISKIAAGWNGPGSKAVDPALLYKSHRLLLDALEGVRVTSPPYTIPNADGSLQIEWRRKSAELEMTLVLHEPPVVWLHSHETGDEIECWGDDAVDLLFRAAPRLASDVSYEGDVQMAPKGPIITIAA